jgi:hypothetical protein
MTAWTGSSGGVDHRKQTAVRRQIVATRKKTLESEQARQAERRERERQARNAKSESEWRRRVDAEAAKIAALRSPLPDAPCVRCGARGWCDHRVAS